MNRIPAAISPTMIAATMKSVDRRDPRRSSHHDALEDFSRRRADLLPR
jgi:hypothetical protein